MPFFIIKALNNDVYDRELLQKPAKLEGKVMRTELLLNNH